VTTKVSVMALLLVVS